MAEPSRPLCADISTEVGEPLTATASRVEHWLLIEYPGLWSRDVLGASLLPAGVKEHLRAELARLPHARLLFVRRPDRRGAGRRRVYLGRTGEADGTLVTLEVGSYEELAALDVAAALEGGAGARRLDHPLLVVCTHGKRDRCCARYGRPVYERLREAAPEEWLWQSTHLGGDRFAGNLVCLPHGLYFGRVGSETAWDILDEYLAGRIALSQYRGRSCYTFPQQAAERAIRDETGLRGLDDLSLLTCTERGAGEWLVRFQAGREPRELLVRREEGELTYLTCDATTLRHPRRFVAKSLSGR